MSPYAFHADIQQFNAHTTHYHGGNALVLADCAKLAYEKEQTIKDAMQKTWAFKNVAFFSGHSTQAFIAGNDAAIIIAFRGTEKNLDDIIADARVKLISGPVGRVHTGFNNALHEVWGREATTDMRSTIKQFQDNNQSIWFCGHSLGAALAVLAVAEYIINDKGTINGLYTIGQPRVGDVEFAQHVDKLLINKYFRFINNNDIVPRVPLPGLIFNYTHAGHGLYIDSASTLHDASVLSWWEEEWDRLKGIVDDIGKVGLDDLKDHGSEEYVALLAKNRAVSTRWS